MKNITLPQRFEDLTLEQFIILQTSESDLDALYQIAEGVDQDELKKLPKKALDTLLAHIDVIKRDYKSSHTQIITIKGEEYGFVNDWDAFTFGEYIDMETYSQDVYANAHKMMSLLYRKIDRKSKNDYWIEPYTSKENSEIFKTIPAHIFTGALVFFSTTRRELLRTTRLSLAKAVRDLTLQENGVGIQRSIHFLERAFSIWTRLRGKVSALLSRTSATSKI